MFIFERGSEPVKARKYELNSDTAYRNLMIPRETEKAGIGPGEMARTEAGVESGKEAI